MSHESLRFYPHYNSALGGYIYTKKDYLRGLKEKGLEPCRNLDYRDQSSKPLRLTRAQSEMVNEAARYQRTGERPSGRFQKAFSELGVTKAPKWLRDAQSLVGGFKEES